MLSRFTNRDDSGTGHAYQIGPATLACSSTCATHGLVAKTFLCLLGKGIPESA